MKRAALSAFTNLQKIYWPKEGFTKGDVIRYYERMGGLMLPYLKNRPESLHRHPNGITGPDFFQKDIREQPPAFVKTALVRQSDQTIRYLLCQNLATLIYMANLGCIEINPWNSRISNPDKPDYMVLDLDPEAIGFDAVVRTAQEVRRVLEKIGAKSLCKTSGATGLHVFVPLKARYTHEQSKLFAALIAGEVHRRLPKTTSIDRLPARRQKKVYLDIFQNHPGQTLAAAYSLRPQPGATVSAPLRWSEVRAGLRPERFHIRNMETRWKKVGDLWEGVLEKGIDMEECLDGWRSVHDS